MEKSTNYKNIFDAIEVNDLKAVKDFLQPGFNINCIDKIGWTPLFYSSVINPTPEIIKTLLEHNADVNCTNQYGWTPLHFASTHGQLEIVKLLLEYGADINYTDKWRQTPLHRACNFSYQRPIKIEILLKHQKIIETLLKYGAQINCIDRDGMRPLHYAAELGYLEIIKTLLECGTEIDINCKADNGWTPLHYATTLDGLEIVKILLEYGANSNCIDNNGKTALDLANESHIGLFGEIGGSIKAKYGKTTLDRLKKYNADKIQLLSHEMKKRKEYKG
jgi:ankyrin repeat protein